MHFFLGLSEAEFQHFKLFKASEICALLNVSPEK